jgi:hypothetical protein
MGVAAVEVELGLAEEWEEAVRASHQAPGQRAVVRAGGEERPAGGGEPQAAEAAHLRPLRPRPRCN